MPKLKLGDNDQPVYQDGKFVLVLDDGSETAFDAVGAYVTFGTIREERDTWKGKAEATSAELVKFGKTAEDRSKTLELAGKARAFDDKKLVDAGKVDEVVAERLKAAKTEWDTEKQGLAAKAEQLSARLRRNLVSKQIAASKVFEDYLITPDLFEAKYGVHFDVDGDEDHVIAFSDAQHKSPIYSRSDLTKHASVDEAVSILLKADPNHDRWKKGVNANGSGATGNAQTGGRGDDSSLPPEERLARGLAQRAGAAA